VIAPLLAAALLGAAGLPASWVPVSRGPDGGVVWEGRIPNREVPSDRRPSAVYLPPGYSAARRYRVVYLLHGMRGSPSSFWDSLRLADVADALIADGRMPPFVAVMPVGGPESDPDEGEWVGPWEDFVVRDVVPWTDAHLSTIADARGRTLAGLSAGGYGAIDIGLRHPGLFGTLESWGGYFAPVLKDLPFLSFTKAERAAHTPTLLVAREPPRHIRFFVSTGGDHGPVLARWTIQFARELTELGVQHELWILPRSERGRFWGATFVPALRYAGEAWTAARAGASRATPSSP
jgi:enterochelin esterase-like enzyme